MSSESVMLSNHLILCHPLLRLPSIFPSIRVFPNESALRIRWPKYWSFSFNISPSNEHPGLISFRMDWLDLLAFQGTFKSLFQHHSPKASILWHSAFFTVQLSHPYMTTGKIIALTRQTFADKVTSLLFTMLSRLVITFLPRNINIQITYFWYSFWFSFSAHCPRFSRSKMRALEKPSHFLEEPLPQYQPHAPGRVPHSEMIPTLRPKEESKG